VPDGVYRLNVSRHPLLEGEEGEVEDESEEPAGNVRYFITTELEVKVEGRDIRDFTIKLAEASVVYGKITVEGKNKPPPPATVVVAPLALIKETTAVPAASATNTAAGAASSSPAAPGAPDTSAPLVTAEALTAMLGDGGVDAYGSFYESESGEFSVWRVPPGSGYVHVLLEPEDTHYVKSIVWKGVDLMREPLRLNGGEGSRQPGRHRNPPHR
jgi:hypothetical protein